MSVQKHKLFSQEQLIERLEVKFKVKVQCPIVPQVTFWVKADLKLAYQELHQNIGKAGLECVTMHNNPQIFWENNFWTYKAKLELCSNKSHQLYVHQARNETYRYKETNTVSYSETQKRLCYVLHLGVWICSGYNEISKVLSHSEVKCATNVAECLFQSQVTGSSNRITIKNR